MGGKGTCKMGNSSSASGRGPIRLFSQKETGQNASLEGREQLLAVGWGLPSLLLLPSSCLDLCFWQTLPSGLCTFNGRPASDPAPHIAPVECQTAGFVPWPLNLASLRTNPQTHTSHLSGGQASQTAVTPRKRSSVHDEVHDQRLRSIRSSPASLGDTDRIFLRGVCLCFFVVVVVFGICVLEGWPLMKEGIIWDSLD